jgi:RES domain-containing protein
MPTAWRIVRASHAEGAFTGEGARRTGGRWNSPGVPMVYASEHKSLAVLEMLVHLDPLYAGRYVTFRIEFDEGLVERFPTDRLAPRWREEMPSRSARQVGDSWIQEARSAVLRVPSAILPEEFNYLFNPAHPQFKSVKMGKAAPLVLDPRLLT